jgi:hypothetical protein
MMLNEVVIFCQMFEATGWKLEEPEVADQEKYDLIVPTIVKSAAGPGHDEEVSEAVAFRKPLSPLCRDQSHSVLSYATQPLHETHSTC